MPQNFRLCTLVSSRKHFYHHQLVWPRLYRPFGLLCLLRYSWKTTHWIRDEIYLIRSIRMHLSFKSLQIVQPHQPIKMRLLGVLVCVMYGFWQLTRKCFILHWRFRHCIFEPKALISHFLRLFSFSFVWVVFEQTNWKRLFTNYMRWLGCRQSFFYSCSEKLDRHMFYNNK